MKHRLLLFTLLFLSTILHAQDINSHIEKLKIDLSNQPSPQEEATIYSDLTWYYSAISTDSALVYGDKAKQAAIALSDSVLLAQVYSDIGAVYFRKGDLEGSKMYYLKSYDIRSELHDEAGVAKINNNLANIYEKKQQYELAMSTFLEALAYFETTDDEKTINIIKGNIGMILFKTKNYAKANGYLREVVKSQERLEAIEDLCVSYLNLGNVYLAQKDTVNALRMYNNSVEASKTVGNRAALSSGYNNIATLYMVQKKNKEAEKLYTEIAKIRNELNTSLDRSNFDFNLANDFFQKGDYEQAKMLLLKTKSVFEENNSYSKLQLTYSMLIQTYAHLSMPDSVGFYANEFVGLNNFLSEYSVNEKTVELETKYQTLQKETLLLEQTAETNRQRLLVNRVAWIALLIALIAILIYIHYKLKHKRQAQEFELKLALSEVEKQNKLQEQRLTISRDLHDNIGSHLTFIISSIDNLKYVFGKADKKLDEKLLSLSYFTKSTIQELRDTIWAMNSQEISFEDLEMQLLQYISKARSYTSGFSFELDMQEDIKDLSFNSVKGMNVYRSVQEALNNSFKYAEASFIGIYISEKAGIAKIRVCDDGKGFDLENVLRGNGLRNMEKRMQEIKGECTIQSSTKGTSVILKVPIT